MLARRVAVRAAAAAPGAVLRAGSLLGRLLGTPSVRAISALSPPRWASLPAAPLRLGPLHVGCVRLISDAAAPRKVGLLALDNLAPNPGAHKRARRVGRGRGGGRGKTSGRGHKGAGARKGNKIPYAGFAGGQAPLYRRIPKRGFTNARFKREFAELNLDTLAHMIRTNRLRVDPEREIGLKELSDCGAVSIAAHHAGVKLLGTGADDFDVPIKLAVSAASSSAIDAIERAGGSIRTVFHDRVGLRAVLSPHKFAVLPRPAYPPPRLMARYMDEAKRGYLSHLNAQPEQPHAAL